jgi:excisionase family DNA binding protein
VNAEPLWDVKDLATFVKTTPDAVYRWVELGLVPHLRLGRSIRFDPAAIREWLATRAVPASKVR